MDWSGWAQIALVWALVIVVGIVISNSNHRTKPK